MEIDLALVGLCKYFFIQTWPFFQKYFIGKKINNGNKMTLDWYEIQMIFSF